MQAYVPTTNVPGNSIQPNLKSLLTENLSPFQGTVFTLRHLPRYVQKAEETSWETFLYGQNTDISTLSSAEKVPGNIIIKHGKCIQEINRYFWNIWPERCHKDISDNHYNMSQDLHMAKVKSGTAKYSEKKVSTS